MIPKRARTGSLHGHRRRELVLSSILESPTCTSSEMNFRDCASRNWRELHSASTTDIWKFSFGARLGIILKSLSFNYQYLVRFRWREIAIMAWFWFLACIFRGYAPKLVGGRAFLPDIFDRVEKQLTLPGIEPERTTIWYTVTITMLVLVYF